MKISYPICLYAAEDDQRAPSCDGDIEIDQIDAHRVRNEQIFQKITEVTSKPQLIVDSKRRIFIFI